MKKFGTIISLIAMVLYGMLGFLIVAVLGKCVRRSDPVFNDRRNCLRGLHGRQSG